MPMMIIDAPDPAGMDEHRKYEGSVAKVEALAADLLGSLGRRKNTKNDSDDGSGGGAK